MESSLTYSEIVYLFADRVITDRARFVNKEDHPAGVSLPVKPLSQLMVLSALAYLEHEGFISLQIKDVKRLLLFSSKAVFGRRIKENDGRVTGIEKILLDNFQQESDVKKATYYLLDNDESSPWGQVIQLSKDSLVQKGLLTIDTEKKLIFSIRHYHYDQTQIAQLSPLSEQVQQQLATFKMNESIYKIAEQSIKKGLADRMEQTSSDD